MIFATDSAAGPSADRLVSPRIDEDEIRRAYHLASLEGLRRVAPIALVGLVVFAGGSGVIELWNFPSRWLPLLLLNWAYLSAGVLHLVVTRRLPQWTLISTLAATWCVHLAVVLYFTAVGGSAELCLIILTALLTGQVIIHPWNASSQLATSVVPIVGFAIGMRFGMQSYLPPIYPIFSLLTMVMLTTLGAGRLNRHRFEAFRRALLLERAATEQSEERRFISAVLDLARAMSLAIDEPKRLAHELAEHTRRAVGADWVLVYRWMADAETFLLAAPVGVPENIAEEFKAIEGDNPWTAALEPGLKQQGAIELLRSEHGAMLPTALLDRWGIRVLRIQRVAKEERRVGMIVCVRTQNEEPFTARQGRLLAAIATQAAIALENASLVEAARAGERIKGEFVATVSHELRTPLNVILGYIDLILERTFGDPPPEEIEALERVRHHSLQLVDLIQGLLDINRLEYRGMTLALTRFSVTELIYRLRASVPDTWRHPGVALIWPDEPVRMLLHSDVAKLEMILRNLIHNALKFTDSGNVTLSTVASTDAATVRFVISDTGAGIAEADLPVIFEMFSQGETGPLAGGVGMGLYIVKRLADALGGTVAVQSRAGEGSSFTLTMPAEPSE